MRLSLCAHNDLKPINIGEKMNHYLLSYDLHNKRNYERIQEGIQHLTTYGDVKPLESLFVFRTHLKAEEIRNILANYTDKDDSIFVIKTDISDWASKNISINIGNTLRSWL